MSTYCYDERISFSVEGFPGCCGIAVICDGAFIGFDEDGQDSDSGLWFHDFSHISTHDEFYGTVRREDGKVGTILFSDNPDGPLDKLYEELKPNDDWEKQELLLFVNPKSGNQVVLKALVRKQAAS